MCVIRLHTALNAGAARNGESVVLYEALHPVMRLWYASTLGAGGTTPRPRDAPRATSGKANADHVLLLGNGPCHGWGVLTHQLALTGQLSRALRARTGRPTDVDFVGDETMNAASALNWLGERDLTRYDAVVVVLGLNDALRLTPVARWTSALRAVLDALLERTRPGTRLLLGGIPRVRSAALYNNLFGALAERHAVKLTRATQAVLAEYDRVDFFPLPALTPEPGRPRGSAGMYQRLATATADRLVSGLQQAAAARTAAAAAQPKLSPSWAWSGAQRAVELAATGGTPELQRITALARDTFKVDVAVVSLLEGTQLYYLTPGALPSSIPRELSYCEVTVEQAAPLLIPDARSDPRFQNNPLVDLSRLVFYAGHPLLSSTGEAIGALCVMGWRPRKAEKVPMNVLEGLARQAQAELWKLEPALPGTAAPAAAVPAR